MLRSIHIRMPAHKLKYTASTRLNLCREEICDGLVRFIRRVILIYLVIVARFGSRSARTSTPPSIPFLDLPLRTGPDIVNEDLNNGLSSS